MDSNEISRFTYAYIFSREPSTYHSYRTPTTSARTPPPSDQLHWHSSSSRAAGARGGICRRAESMADEPMTANSNREERPPEAVLVVPIKPPTRAAAFQAAALPLGMVMVQVLTVVMLLLSKLALNTGMRPAVLIVYRNLIAAAAVAPLAFVFERY